MGGTLLGPGLWWWARRAPACFWAISHSGVLSTGLVGAKLCNRFKFPKFSWAWGPLWPHLSGARCPACERLVREKGFSFWEMLWILFFFFLNRFFLKFFKIYLFIYLWLCWVFVSVRGLSLVAASGDHSSLWCAGLSLSRPLLLQSTGSRCAGSVIVTHGPSCSAACGIFPDPVSPALAGRFSTTAPPGKPLWIL